MSNNSNSAEISKKQIHENQRMNLKLQMFNSAKISYILALIFFIISFLFNGLIITPWNDLVQNAASSAEGPTALGVIDIAIKSVSIILSFIRFYFLGKSPRIAWIYYNLERNGCFDYTDPNSSNN